MVALTQSRALALAPRGGRANVICPGNIAAPINVASFATIPDSPADQRRVGSLHRFGRIDRGDEVASAIGFLAGSAQSGFVTGGVVIIDGGRSALLQDLVQ